MPVPILETPQLWLYPLVPEDAPAVQALFPQWGIVRFLSDVVPWPYPVDGAQRFICDVVQPDVAAGHGWYWSIRHKRQPADLIGVISLHDREDENRGFWIAPPWQRQGLATQACACVTAFWFDVLQKPRLRVYKAIDNVASVKISEHSGMRQIGMTDKRYVSGVLPTQVWEITREEWMRLH